MHDSALISIRAWTPDDSEAVLRVHYAAVHHTAAAEYDLEVRQDWSPPVTDERIARYIANVARTDQTTLVATLEGRVVGFASVVAPQNELRAVYVLPAVGRCGIGSRLLISVEELARVRGLTELHLDSSLNAVEFYSGHGYVAEGSAEHVLSTGRKMRCVPMRKLL
jgi:GNAT superfamily N-acetyltransferase